MDDYPVYVTAIDRHQVVLHFHQLVSGAKISQPDKPKEHQTR